MKIIRLFILMFFVTLRANAADSQIDNHLINEMLTSLNNQYLFEINNEEIIVSGLQFLHDMDKDVVISKGTDKIYIYYKQKIAKIVALPQDKTNILQWVDCVSKVFVGATQISEIIETRDFELPDLFMKKICESLDGNSHYYSEYDYEEKERENSIYTLYSDRKIDDVLYLKVRVFNKQTAKNIADSLQKRKPYAALIIDLRANSGGMLNEALKTAGLFTDGIIAYTAGKNNRNKHYYSSDSQVVYDGPMVVLVDGQTASAAEVLAGGLQAQSRAKIIGTPTFGKGTIQNIIQMSNGGKLALTAEQFFTPSDNAINKRGIIPDVCSSEQIDGICQREERPDMEEDIELAIKTLKN